MKKIGILNFQHGNHNYGAVLQAAALESIVRNFGYDAEHIDLRTFDSQYFMRRIFQKYFKKKTFRNTWVFEDFRRRWLHRTLKKFYTPKDLDAYCFNYDTVVVGSDQVWRFAYTGKFLRSYFLDFLPASTRKIAYAASYGLSHWELSDNAKDTACFKSLIKQFHAVSVRESTGVEICRDVFGVNALHVLDPTLLAGRAFFDKILSDAGKNTGICASNKIKICYCMLDTTESFQQLLNSILQDPGFTAESIYPATGSKKTYYDTVPDWLMKIRESDFILTDSFHCVCISILFHKQFLCFSNPDRGISRLISLLEKLCLTDRIISSEQDSAVVLRMVKRPIDYANVDKCLEKLKRISADFLHDNL